jgi:OOP family OmpA-OmpF porin
VLTNKLSIVTGFLMLTTLSDTAIAQNGFYVFGAFGNTNSDIYINFDSRVHDDSNSYKFGAGYAVNRNLSIEAAYQVIGSQNAITGCPPDIVCIELVFPLVAKADLTAWSLTVTGSIPLTDRFDVFGKAGIARWDIGFDGISSAFDTSDEDLLYGAGLRWSEGDHWKVFVEYEKVELGVDTVGIGVSYYF